MYDYQSLYLFGRRLFSEVRGIEFFSLQYLLYSFPHAERHGCGRSDIQDRLVNLINVPDINLRSNLYTTEDFLDSLQVSKNYMADQNLYIRERIFDMWIGDWNKTNENWEWQSHTVNDSVIYTPIVIDRNHAFTKVDGVLFKQMLKMLSLDFICNYDSLILKDTKKINKLAFALDMAVAAAVMSRFGYGQAQEIRKQTRPDSF